MKKFAKKNLNTYTHISSNRQTPSDMYPIVILLAVLTLFAKPEPEIELNAIVLYGCLRPT
ncbi:hypothetical protein Turpa_3547 [Turneriella parva DSM 21527]|uniref:Uncharacterized protein n=1 Tax=Turneriella parva (strain ATCC BAA-1111 / DSM 21527 / NCTC 11395 / H) TaxID=869212 RepID=I4BA75_TURPD|nr:hypothetical protein Turpa_3547 [Turneriella parva DSM 21527]